MVGAGAAAAYGHLPALSRLGVRPAALIDPRLDFVRPLAKRFGVPRVVADLAEAAPELDAAVIAAPPPVHAELALPLLAAGVHVLCEKPLATDSADARRMVETAAASGARLAVSHQGRFLFVNRWIEAAITAGALGDIERVTVRKGRNWRLRPETALPGTAWTRPEYWNPDSPDCAGGVLRDWAVHLLDALLWWLGPVRAFDYADDGEGGLEADLHLELQFESGAAATVEASRLRALSNTVTIEGSRGSLEANLVKNELLRLEPDSLRNLRFPVTEGVACHDEGAWAPGGPGEHLVADWLSAIREGREPFASGASSLPAIELMDRCLADRRRRRAGGFGPVSPVGPVGPVASAASAAPPAWAALRGKTVLVTGATGFLGGHLVERLAASGVRVRAAVRRFRAAARIARFPPETVEMREFDLAAPDASGGLDDLLEGCAAVFHLARDREAAAPNLLGARRLGAACARRGIRLVFTGAYPEHSAGPDGFLPESELPDDARPPSAGASCERELARLRRESGLEVVVLRPTVVYGPFAADSPEPRGRALLAGRLVLPSPGDGICNAVYVDDVVSALLLAAVKDEAAGETFLVSGAEHPTWLEARAARAAALGRPNAVRLLSREAFERRFRRRRQRLRDWVRRRSGLHRRLWQVRRAGGRGFDRARTRLRRTLRRPDGSVASLLTRPRGGAPPGGAEALPTPRLFEEFSSRRRARIDKARRLLGYEPAFDLARGMERTAEYLRWVRASGGSSGSAPRPGADEGNDEGNSAGDERSAGRPPSPGSRPAAPGRGAS